MRRTEGSAMGAKTRAAGIAERFRLKQSAISVLAHGLVLLSLAGAFRRAPRIVPSKLPGTAHGVQVLTYFAGGSPNRAESDLPTMAADKPKPKTNTRIAQAKPVPQKSSSPSVDRGASDQSASGLGDGEINMAQLTYFPHPKPDLSSLPRGTQGDIVLNAVIDVHGRISELTLLKGLGAAVDEQVITAVRGWTYSPATRNGAPVPSEQELHFHYERG